jgi:hypothetical protein
MSESKGKTPGKPAPPSGKPDEPGRISRDDEGNVSWQWSNDEVLQADDTLGAAERMRALVDPKLDVVEDEDLNPVKPNPKGLKKGYNPYDSGALGKDSWKKKKNLRELSKWIELKRQMDEKKKNEDK